MKHIKSVTILCGLALSGCVDSPLLVPTSSGQSAVLAVSDGAHEGNVHFYFRPPIAKGSEQSGAFDGTLEPEVRVCVWTGSDCGAIIAQFTTETGPSSETIRVEPDNGQYVVNWQTEDVLSTWPLDEGESYRILVLVGSQVLGWADVWIVENARGTRTGDDPLLIDGQTLPIKFRIEQGAPTEESASGIAAALGAGYYHSCAVDQTGAAWCWGGNQYGQLGTGTWSDYSTTPKRVVGTLVFRSVHAGLHHTCGITVDGLAYCWGYNNFGQLGTGSTSPFEAEPRPVAGGLSFASLAPGGNFTCGLTTEGTAYCWGYGGQGQLGGNSYPYDEQASPMPVAGGSSYRLVAAGQNHACGITTDDVPQCWGDNTHGQLGVGAGVPRASQPTTVLGLTLQRLDAGYLSTCGVTGSGVAYCWGHNAFGQVGSGSANPIYPFSQPNPIAVAGGHSFDLVEAGGFHTCGIATGGAAYCWGFNGYGQLGNGSFAVQYSPSAVIGGFTFGSLTTGAYHTCGLTTSLEALCWGGNVFGSLGDGTQVGRSQPVSVADLDLTP